MIRELNIGDVANIIWPLVTGLVAYFVKTYYEYKLRIREAQITSTLRTSEERERVFTKTIEQAGLKRGEIESEQDKELRELVLKHWSQICQIIGLIEQADSSDNLVAVLKDFHERIDSERVRFTRSNLFMPPELATSFAIFFINTEQVCKKQKRLNDQLDLRAWRKIINAIVDEQGKLSVAARKYFGLEDSKKSKYYIEDPCPECGNYSLIRNGTCLKCDTCGATCGCS